MKLLLPLSVGVLVVACASPSEPRSDGLDLEFAARKVSGFVAEPKITVSGRDGRIIVRAGLWTGCGGYTLAADATAGPDLMLRVIANARSPQKACYMMVEYFEHEAALRGLAPGRYRLDIVHVYKWWNEDPHPEVRRRETASIRVTVRHQRLGNKAGS